MSALKTLENTNLAGVPLVDYWLRLGPYLAFGGLLHGISALGAWWSGASFWAWQGYCVLLFLFGTVIVSNRAWQLQTPLAIRPGFAHWFTGLYHAWLGILVGVGQILAFHSLWSVLWVPAWFFLTQGTNWLLVWALNRLYRSSKNY